MIYYEFLKFKQFMVFKSILKKVNHCTVPGPHSAHGLGLTAMPACPTRWPKAGRVARLARPKVREAAQTAGRHSLRVVTARTGPHGDAAAGFQPGNEA
jgi:hypothetical protein